MSKTAEKSQSNEKKAERTPEQRLADIRKNYGIKFAVTPEDQKWVLALYDGSLGTIKTLTAAAAQAVIRIDDLLRVNGEILLALGAASVRAENAELSVQTLTAQVADLLAQNEEFRSVYRKAASQLMGENVIPLEG